MTIDHRICFVGDSYTHGTSDEAGLGWAGRLGVRARARGYDLTCYNLGIRRETSTDIARRWQTECTPRLSAPNIESYIVFAFGANDITNENGQRRVSEAETLANLRDVTTGAKTEHNILVVGPAPMSDPAENERMVRLCAAMEDEAARLAIPYLSLVKPFINDAEWFRMLEAGDGDHPAGSGYERIANLVDAWPAWWFREPI